MLLLDVVHLVFSFSPKVFHEFALGALSVFSDRLLVLDMLIQHVYGVTIPCSHWFALLGISCSAEKVNGYTCDSTRQMVICCFANVSFEYLVSLVSNHEWTTGLDLAVVPRLDLAGAGCDSSVLSSDLDEVWKASEGHSMDMEAQVPVPATIPEEPHKSRRCVLSSDSSSVMVFGLPLFLWKPRSVL